MKTKKRGFTLIELLAVIVILAIIALIATPIVLNIIKDSKNNAQLRSAEMYVDGVEQAVAKEKMNDTTFNPNTCSINNGNLICDNNTENEITVEVKGEKPTSGKITFQKGKVDQVTLEYSDKTITKDSTGSLVFGESAKIEINAPIVYFDVQTGKSCTNYHVDNSKTGYNGIGGTGNQNSCLKFYAFNDTEESETISLLLDHNTTAKTGWSYSYTNSDGPGSLLPKLKADTENWVGTITPSNYQYKGSRSYTIDYSEYKARLITANEIAQITGKTGWDETSSSYYEYYFNDLSFNANTGRGDVCASKGCVYAWLYDRTSTSCKDYGCLNNSDVETSGYWTATAMSSFNDSAWIVYYTGYFVGYFMESSNGGIRPVIEVLKSNLN